MTIERHLVLQELTLHPAGEWTPSAQGWTVLRVAEGVGYSRQGSNARELNPGDGFTCNGRAQFILRASSLGQLRLEFYLVQPQFLNGLLTVAETHRLERCEDKNTAPVFLFTAQDTIGQKFKHLVAQPQREGLAVRSGLLQLWSQAIGNMLTAPVPDANLQLRLRERFREFIGKMPDAELAIRLLPELAGELNCSERHFSRMFREEFGVALRNRQTELRLLRARQLLVDSNAKIINVAYESGYRHLGLFNTMFKKRFGLTPGEWRQKNFPKAVKKSSNRTLAMLAVVGSFACAGEVRAELQDNPEQAAARAALVQKLFEAPPVIRQDPSSLPVTLPPDTAPVKPAVTILVTASPTLLAEGNAKKSEAAATNAVAGFKVENYLVEGNSLLPENELQRILLNSPTAFGTNVVFGDIRGLLGDLQMAYRERGFVTVSVALPPQKLTNATVKIKVTEGRLSGVTVKGNEYFSTENVLRSLPSLRSNMMLNSHVFQTELDAANANRDRQIYPVISPGPEPGTTELALKVKDRFPVHGRVEINNSGTPGTPEARVTGNAQYGNLWQLEHQIGFAYGFSPLSFNSGKNFYFSPLDLPLIANQSLYYRLPLAHTQSIQKQIDDGHGQFGYNEVTHKFVMPPPSGHPELTLYTSRAVSDTGVQLGTLKHIIPPPNLVVIDSQDSGQNVTLNQNLGAKFNLPLPTLGKFASSLSFGVDYKQYNQVSYNTNNFIATITYTNQFGPTNLIQTIPSAQPTRHSAVTYFPLNLGFSTFHPDKYGSSSFNVQGNYNIGSVGSLSQLAYSAGVPATIISNAVTHVISTNTPARARDNYFTIQAGVVREQRLYHDWTMLIRADGQWASTPLFSNERFSMGGTAGVRGFSEGSSQGDAGWRASIEPRTPLINVGVWDGDVPMWMRGSVFLDYGQLFTYSTTPQTPKSIEFMGAGCGLTASIGSHLDARVMLAWPVMNPFPKSIANNYGGDGMHVYFGAGGQF